MCQINGLSSQTVVKGLLDKHGLVVKKKYGQNFLVDDNILQKIINASEITKNDLVVEIGPGLGVLTAALAERAGRVIAVEIDSAIIPALKENLSRYDNVDIIYGDILKLSLNSIAQGKPCKIVANLPYYITTPIIFAMLESGARIDGMVVMVQKEVGDRMRAVPSTKAYGALTLSIAYYADVSVVADVSPNCFYPRPEVDSAVIKFKMLERPRVRVSDVEKMFGVIGAAFSMRRKTLFNCLRARFELPKERIALAIDQTGLSADVRGEALTLEQFAALTDNLL